MIRVFRDEDAGGVLALIRELLPLRVETLETVLFDARRARTWVADEGGEVVGAARLRGSKLALGVAKRARGRGLGTALWERVAVETRSLWTADEDGIVFARARGFVPTRRVVTSSLDLREAAPRVAAPAGVELVCWDELETVPAELQAAEHVEFPALVPRGSWAALVDGRPVSYALLAADERGLGESQFTFTLPAHRGRGLATLCKSALAASARERGLHTLVTGNDADNAAILAVNRKLGYRERQVLVTLTRAGAETASGRGPAAPAR